MANSDLLAAFGLGGSPGSATGDAGLNAFSKLIGENNIYRQAAAPVLSAQFNTTGWSPAEIIGSAAIKAFLGATLNRLGAQSEGDQLTKVAAVMPQLTRDPASVMLPEGVDPAAFNILKLAEMSKQASAEESIKKALATDKLVSYDPETEAVKMLPGGKSVMMDLLSPQIQVKKVETEQKQKESALSVEKEMRERMESSGIARSFQDVSTNFDAMKSVFKQDNRAADLTFISSFARILDPASVVREGEIRNVENTQDMLGRLGYSLTSIVSGKTRLGPDLKAALLDAAGSKVNEFGKNYTDYVDKNLGVVTRSGGSAENVPYVPFKPFSMEGFLGSQGGSEPKTDLSALAKQFPNTPEGKAAFKAAIAKAMGGG